LQMALALSKDPETIVVAKKMIELTSEDPYVLSQLGWAYGVLGKREEAQGVLTQLEKLSRRSPVPPPAVFYVHLGLGNLDATMEYMEKAYREKWSDVVWIKSAPEYDVLRSNERFVALLEKMHFPE